MSTVKKSNSVGRSVKNMSGNKNTHKTISNSLVNKIKNVDTQNWIYVTPKNHEWVVKLDGAVRALGVYKHRNSAMNFAKKYASPLPDFQIIVFNSAGEISNLIIETK